MSFFSEKTAVFIDGDNTLLSLKRSGIELDFIKLHHLLISRFGQPIQSSYFGDVEDPKLLHSLIETRL